MIAAEGGEPVSFPALAIEPALEPERVRQTLVELGAFDFAVFVSANAVDYGLAMMTLPWPAGIAIAAVGRGTAQALNGFGLTVDVVPAEGADSEALLAQPQLEQVRGKRIVIFRGTGGRELLAETLRQRGADVRVIECYRRTRPDVDPAELIARWQQGAIHAVTALSGETLGNLWTMLGAAGQKLLMATPLFVPHLRIADRAAERGLTEVCITAPGDAGIVRGLCTWFSLSSRRGGPDAA